MPYRPQKFHCRSKIPFLGICRGEPYLANKISGIHLGRKKNMYFFSKGEGAKPWYLQL